MPANFLAIGHGVDESGSRQSLSSTIDATGGPRVYPVVRPELNQPFVCLSTFADRCPATSGPVDGEATRRRKRDNARPDPCTAAGHPCVIGGDLLRQPQRCRLCQRVASAGSAAPLTTIRGRRRPAAHPGQRRTEVTAMEDIEFIETSADLLAISYYNAIW
jgi:hypothetical protein